MRQVLTIRRDRGSVVPDGTTVYPLLNPGDATSGLDMGLLDPVSLAAGVIAPGQRSKIHVLPCVTQVTFVLRGALEVRMKDPAAPEPYTLSVGEEQAALTRPGTFLQFHNPGQAPCHVLYVVSPAYLFELGDGGAVRYDDAVTLDEDWPELAALNWRPTSLPATEDHLAARRAAVARRGGGIPWAGIVHRLKPAGRADGG